MFSAPQRYVPSTNGKQMRSGLNVLGAAQIMFSLQISILFTNSHTYIQALVAEYLAKKSSPHKSPQRPLFRTAMLWILAPKYGGLFMKNLSFFKMEKERKLNGLNKSSRHTHAQTWGGGHSNL